MYKSISLVAVGLLAGCASTSGTSSTRTMTYAEAAAFENDLLARSAHLSIAPPSMLFTQPVNKTEPCKLPTTQDQLDRKNFRAYWDGECKNGYAYGLGRDIAISDTHHVEEITVHGGSANDFANRPVVSYDFVNNLIQHYVLGENIPAVSGMFESIKNELGKFSVEIWLRYTDGAGNSYALLTSPFNPQRFYKIEQGYVEYRLTDLTNDYAASSQPLRAIQIFDRKTGIAGGVQVVQYRNGVVEHHGLSSNGQDRSLVIIPSEYVNHLTAKFAKAQEAISAASVSVQKSQQIEREYLYMACNGKHNIEGLDNATATKICTWRDQFKEPYEKAQAHYQQQMEQRRQQVAAEEQQLAQQRMNQQLLAQQQAIVNQQAWQNLNNTLQNTANQINQINQQTQQLMNFQAPQVQPITPPGGNQITCIRSGVVTNCQY